MADEYLGSNELNIDNINIKASAELGDSVKNLKKLTNSLAKLDTIAQKADFSNIEAQIRKFEKINLSGISGQIKDIQGAMSYLNKTPKAENLFTPEFETNLENATVSIERMQEAFVPLEQTTVVLNDVAETAGAAANNFEWLKEEADESKNAFIKIKDAAEDAGGSMSLLSLYTKRVADSADAGRGKLGKFLDALKRIALYRAVRSILKHVADAFKEGMSNIAKYSEEANASLSQIKTSSLYLKNSLGAMLMPVLAAVTPLIKTVAEGLVSVANNLNMMLAAMRGQATYTKAIEYWQDYTEAVNAAKAATIGIDELNVVNKMQGGIGGAADMFEEANVGELSGFYKELRNTLGWIGDHLETIASVIGVIIGYNLLVKVGAWATGIGALASKVLDTSTSFGALTSSIVAAGGVYAAFMLAKSGAQELARYLAGDDKASLTGSILSLVGGAGSAAVAGAVIGGPVGAVIGGLAFLVGAMVGIGEAQAKMRLDRLREDFFKGGVEINKVTLALENYFKSLDIDTQGEWIKKIKDAQKAYEGANVAFTLMWDKVKNRGTVSSDDISKLGDAFNKLADAAKNLNTVKFDSLMGNISRAIRDNISPSLTTSLDNLLEKLYDAQAFIDSKVSGISERYQRILNDISASGGKITAGQRTELSDLRKQMGAFTLTPNVEAASWERIKEDISKTGIHAGSSAADVEKSIARLADALKPYEDSITKKYDEDVATLKQLIDIDRTQFGGKLGFSLADLTALEASYKSQLNEVYGEYNYVLDQLLSQYSKQAVKYDPMFNYDWLDWLGQDLLYTWKTVNPFSSEDYFDKPNKSDVEVKAKLYAEQQKAIAILEAARREVEAIQTKATATGGGSKTPVTARAGGGLVPSGDLFFANEGGVPEYVGTFGDNAAAANPDMIVEGIKRGVAEAGTEERMLLREQNGLIRALLEKETSIHIGDDAIGKANARYSRSRGVPVSKGVFADGH